MALPEVWTSFAESGAERGDGIQAVCHQTSRRPMNLVMNVALNLDRYGGTRVLQPPGIPESLQSVKRLGLDEDLLLGEVSLCVLIARSLHIRHVLDRPLTQRGQGGAQGVAEGRKHVLDLGRNDRIDGAYNQTIGLQVPERLRKHLLADAVQSLAQFRVAMGLAVAEYAQRQDGPPVADP